MSAADNNGLSVGVVEATVVQVPRAWAKTFRRLLGLAPGRRYLLVLTVPESGAPCDIAIMGEGTVAVLR